ncbi:cardiolipin synthase [Halanaerobium sp. ST460_2HS_T2]|uniref:Phosphatidylglycerophosphate synthase n=1 Tax=Halanaerobium kushneri TaxID=56779 RepID=A0A1N7BGJ7_9FIRM|nr:CDP-alcohol phosphatidyltransferase family protein [Halanaerobium sp. ST460_2HS_T2]RCW61976.1 cardiolipin synthase [Halanaerobium sp. ST460_2HS_T2]SIR50465.1 CDP-diacylglycerol--glycerol-3-phosphate 3-phosphatidyltransferase [Halanaerobium kushneri]
MFTIPNYITFFRILLIPVYLYNFVQGNIIAAAILFAVSAVTDFLDGYIARKYNLESKTGKLLDPLADKLTIVSILLVLIYLNIIPRFISYIILIRELFILLSGIITYIYGLNFINPSFIGKLSVALLYFAIALKLLEFDYLGNLLFYIVIPINIYSALDYSYRAYKKIYK